MPRAQPVILPSDVHVDEASFHRANDPEEAHDSGYAKPDDEQSSGEIQLIVILNSRNSPYRGKFYI
jgi:hypothetical protein